MLVHAEMNLFANDLGNMPFARRFQMPWLLVADIDRGGVFAQIIGTQALLADDWHRCCGIVVNRLRGDQRFFAQGAQELQERTGKPVWTVPFRSDISLPAEDSYSVKSAKNTQSVRDNHNASRASLPRQGEIDAHGTLAVVAVQLPYAAMTSDLAPIAHDPSFQLAWHDAPPIDDPSAVIIPEVSKLELMLLGCIKVVGRLGW